MKRGNMHTYNENLLPYQVGGLLYTPALNTGIVKKILEGSYPGLTSLAFCLEDSIQDASLEEAQKQLKQSLNAIKRSGVATPLLFVRVRTPGHMDQIHHMLAEDEAVLTGYVLPKFDLSNGPDYVKLADAYNKSRPDRLFIMPILESRPVADIGSRVEVLWKIKGLLDTVKPYVLNIRVGGNDFSNMYGLRRKVDQNIYEIGVIRDILVNIINVFASDYVVSGPVWEYFGDDPGGSWAAGLRKEIELDLLNGFFGKTAIHPSQLPVIFDSLKVSRADYEDARSILHWGEDGLAVAKSADGGRMNEVKCHGKWAGQILTRAAADGVR